ncbi:MAG: M23 family metallopeptidase [Actinomycetota bacterium]|nr:M23 family metallopeptidase [Actinomycetota bacterium]
MPLRASSALGARAARSAARRPTGTPALSTAQGPAAAKAAAATRAAAALASAHRWVTPLDVRYTLTSRFGMRWGSMHPGQDFAVAVGSPIKAMSSGTVIFAGWAGGYGNKVEIRYWNGTISWYAHNSRLQVAVGTSVSPGQVVALSGNTGHSTGPHSHIEIHLGGDNTVASAVPPLPWLNTHRNMPGRSVGGSSTASD